MTLSWGVDGYCAGDVDDRVGKSYMAMYGAELTVEIILVRRVVGALEVSR